MISCWETDNIAKQRAYRAERSREEIIIGAAYPGAQTSFMLRQGIEMAVKEVNAAGGVFGRKLRIILKNDERSLTKGKVIAEEFAMNRDMIAFIGHLDSYISVPVSILYEFYGLVMMSPASTAQKLTRQGFRLVFRNIPNTDQYANQLAEFSYKRGFKRMVIYHIRDNYGREFANAFEKRAGKLGVKIVDRSAYDLTSNADNFQHDLNNWKEYYNFDAIFLAGVLPQAAIIISTARKMGITVPIVGSDRLASPNLLTIAGEAAEGTIAISSFNWRDPDPLALKFTKAFNERYGVLPSGAAAQGYDAVKVLAYAIKKAQSTVPTKVAEALRSTKNWHGVTGLTTFDEKGDVIDKELNLMIVRNGQFEYLHPAKPQKDHAP